MNYIKMLSVALVAMLSFNSSFSQLVVNPNQTALVLATKLAGPGISISSPTLTCPALANGKFVSTATPLGLDSGIILTTGRSINTAGVEAFLASTNNGAPGDASLTALAGAATHDACYLEFDLIPNGDTISFRYVFGSEEYINSVCGIYNDAFAFFISGPGIPGTQNMALIPGTTIPVTVNSINNGIPGGSYSIATCNAMGPGSPYTSYYSSNIGGTQLTYRGYTMPMRAFHSVTPCSTYHLKMTIADAGNFLYDSGVFIEAGSLKTNTYHFIETDSMGITLLGVPHTIVKGCDDATIRVKSDHAISTPQTVSFTYGGSAVNGVDFTGPATAVIPAGDTIATINITGLATATTGTKTLAVYLQSPFSCGVVDTINLTILDTPTVAMLTPDTAICLGQSFTLRATAPPILNTMWTPSATLSSPASLYTTAAPVVTTTYTITGTLAAAGCPPVLRSVHVTVNTGFANIITPDTSICKGATFQLHVTPGSGTTTYSWSPGAGLNSASLMEPIASPAVTTTYTLTAVDPAIGCPGFDAVTITVFTPDAYILTPDTSICTAASFELRAYGASTLTYSWSPAVGLSNATVQNPIASPAVTTIYELTAAVPGTPCYVADEVVVTVIPPVIADAGKGKAICISVPIQLYGQPSGANYSYNWGGPGGYYSGFQDPYVGEATVGNSGVYTLTVTDMNTSCVGVDTTNIVVNTSSIMLSDVTKDQTIDLGSSIQLNAQNALYYTWTPNDGSLTDANINNPVATPTQKTTYIVYGIDIEGCRDTAYVTIDIDYKTHDLIPSAFTPNGDGLNDVFRPVGMLYQRLVDFKVYNRWGQQVFSSANIKNGWDGTFNGAAQEQGVYHYSIIISHPDGKETFYKGDVTLIR
ncbi:MAG: choice-of-anchor L domain-containing protein [Bacteroidota bacterium]